ncbi:MAG: hypothetical protein KGS72_10805 [Cyanobacteria bacterium REEB67]|nr:hypothetical protein [Cyanobacteria bacterium REEB67]
MRPLFSLLTSISMPLLASATAIATTTMTAGLQNPVAAAVSAPPIASTAAITDEISTYEKKFFERSFDGENNDHRLDRLENFIFGATSTGAPQVRIAKIARIVPLAAVPLSVTTNSGATAAGGHSGPAATRDKTEPGTDANILLESPGHYPHITALEGEILGATYETQPLPQRLARMEVKIFGKASTSNDMEERTDAIDQYERAKRKPKDVTIGQLTPYSHQESLAEQARHYDSVDDDPGAIVRRQTIQQELEDAQKSTPPSAEERTLSRVAWCEQQIFGHSFPEMHLLARLHQLNAELFPKDKEKDIQLMDRIDVIVREVVLRKQPHQPKTS